MIADVQDHARELAALAYVAGAALAVSSMPKVLRNIVTGLERVEAGSGFHYALILVGNALWTVYGIAYQIAPMVLFCSVNTLLHAVLLVQMHLARTRRSTR